MRRLSKTHPGGDRSGHSGQRDAFMREIALSVWLFLTCSLAAAQETAPSARTETVQEALCRMIETSAKSHNLPVAFFTRLIWQESSFRTGAVSPAGAQGVAQFMPGTAAERGLVDPFDPEQAIPKAAGRRCFPAEPGCSAERQRD